jgi:hypothetical protein
MRVYYFTSAIHGLENIKRNRIKISDFSNLNDPFELLGIEMSDRDVREAVRFEKSKIARNTGLICFSETKYDPVQWAHYTDNHKGVCLGFDVPKEKLKEVKYVSERLAKSTLTDTNKVEKLLTTKFKHWSYEMEWRLIIDTNYLNNSGELMFESFSDSLILKEVYIGCQSALKFEDVISNTGVKNNSITIKHTRPSFKGFRIVWDQSKRSKRV